MSYICMFNKICEFMSDIKEKIVNIKFSRLKPEEQYIINLSNNLHKCENDYYYMLGDDIVFEVDYMVGTIYVSKKYWEIISEKFFDDYIKTRTFLKENLQKCIIKKELENYINTENFKVMIWTW